MGSAEIPLQEQCLAVIPARGGSKRIPRKNVRVFAGLPLMVRPIRTALRSGLFRDVVVSTDDAEIALIAEREGASVPFRRSAALADDMTPVGEVVADVARRLQETSRAHTTHICLIYPAAVFTTATDLSRSLGLLTSHDLDQVFSACAHPAPILRAWHQTMDGTAEMIWPEHRLTRSQDLPEAFYDCGQFAWATTEYWCDDESRPQARCGLYLLPRERAHDIDTEDDLATAEALFALQTSTDPD